MGGHAFRNRYGRRVYPKTPEALWQGGRVVAGPNSLCGVGESGGDAASQAEVYRGRRSQLDVWRVAPLASFEVLGQLVQVVDLDAKPAFFCHFDVTSCP